MADCRKCKFGEVDFEGTAYCNMGDRITIPFCMVESVCEDFVDKEETSKFKEGALVKVVDPKLSCCALAPRCIDNDVHSWFITVEMLSGDSVHKLVVKDCPFCGVRLPTPCSGSEVEDYQNLEDLIMGDVW